MTDRIDAAEEQIAHLTRILDDLSDVVAAQADKIDRLTRRVEMLIQRDTGQDGTAAPAADQRPPHW
ncbi:SlyX protein [Rhodobacteraceae bacterium MBR-64]|jgi:SlyX protein